MESERWWKEECGYEFSIVVTTVLRHEPIHHEKMMNTTTKDKILWMSSTHSQQRRL